MSEKTNKKPVETEEVEVTETEQKTGGKKKPAKPAKEKEGLFTRGKNWCKRNKSALIAGAVGVGTGVAGTIAVSELGKRSAERRAVRTNVQQTEVSPLDPNY